MTSLRKSRVIKLASLWAIVLSLLVFTSPQQLLVAMLIVPFVILIPTLYVTSKLIADFILPPKSNTDTRRTVLIGIGVASVVVCLGLQSIGELSLRDILPVVLFISLVYFYILRNSS